jgi:hypothetical protein
MPIVGILLYLSFMYNQIAKSESSNMIIRSQVHNTLRAKALLLPGNMVHIIASLCAILLFVALFIVSISPVQAQTADYPEPLQPANNATDIGVTNITFTWSPYYVGTDKYTFQIATNTEFADNDIVFKTVVSGTTYVYKATALSYDTTYWWRVMASEPLGGNWSPIQRFSTKINTPATPAPEPEESDSFFSSIKDFFTDADPLMIGLIAAGVIVVVLAIYVVFLQPASKKSAARSQQAPPPTFGGASPQAGARCPQCGSPNTPGRKFCGSCGANLSPTPHPHHHLLLHRRHLSLHGIPGSSPVQAPVRRAECPIPPVAPSAAIAAAP